MMMMVGSLRVPGGFALPPSNQPVGFTPDPLTAISNPGVYYRGFNAPDGSPLGLYKTGPRQDGFILGDGAQFFDGNRLWNRRMGSETVSALINDLDLVGLQVDQDIKWQQGLTSYPPNYDIPRSYPPLPGTPLNPFGGFPNYAMQGGLVGMPPFNGGTSFGGTGGAIPQQGVPQQAPIQGQPQQQPQQPQQPAPAGGNFGRQPATGGVQQPPQQPQQSQQPQQRQQPAPAGGNGWH